VFDPSTQRHAFVTAVHVLYREPGQLEGVVTDSQHAGVEETNDVRCGRASSGESLERRDLLDQGGAGQVGKLAQGSRPEQLDDRAVSSHLGHAACRQEDHTVRALTDDPFEHVARVGCLGRTQLHAQEVQQVGVFDRCGHETARA
jgi:hypothetical protein